MHQYYRILNIPPNAGLNEIKRAYRRKSMKYHPDRNHAPDAAQQFIKISKAYQALIKYKTTGHQPVYTRPTAPSPSKSKQYKNTRFTEEQMQNARKRYREKTQQKKNKPLTFMDRLGEFILKSFTIIIALVFMLIFIPASIYCLIMGFTEAPVFFMGFLLMAALSMRGIKIFMLVFKKK